MAGRRGLKRLIRRPWRLVRDWLQPLRAALRPPGYGALRKRVEWLEANLRHVVLLQHPEVAAETDQRTALRRSECRILTENGEGGILLHLFGRLGATDRRFIEFGIGDVTKCNAANLALSFGWSGLLLDGHAPLVEAASRFFAEARPRGPSAVKAVHAMLTPDNVNAIFADHGFSGSIDLMSVDIDGNDYWVWKAIEVVEPRVVVIEYNASLGLDEPLITRYAPNFDRYAMHPRGWYHSASLTAIEKLGREKGYVLVGCESSGHNAFFVRRDVAADRLRALPVKDAYYPDARRSRVASPEEQLRTLRDLPFDFP